MEDDVTELQRRAAALAHDAIPMPFETEDEAMQRRERFEAFKDALLRGDRKAAALVYGIVIE